jgi:hypothetical protein
MYFDLASSQELSFFPPKNGVNNHQSEIEPTSVAGMVIFSHSLLHGSISADEPIGQAWTCRNFFGAKDLRSFPGSVSFSCHFSKTSC